MKTFLDIMKILLTKDENRLIFAILCADVVVLFFIRYLCMDSSCLLLCLPYLGSNYFFVSTI